MTTQLPPTAWTTGTTEVFKTGTWRAALPVHIARPAPCAQACPVNGDIAQWIGHARAGDMRRAWEVLTGQNPFPAVAGRVCHHPCESACNRGAFDEAVSICRLERAVGDTAIAKRWAFEAVPQDAPGHVAVIGAGPSGLSAAFHLRRRGWRVSVHESRPQPGGLMRYGIPPYRLPREVLDAEIGRIVALGVEMHCGQALDAGAFARIAAAHDAVYIATGAAQSTPLPQLPVAAPWLMQGSEYLARSNEGDVPEAGPRVVVIGGGSAAIDVARSARRAGCEVAMLALEPRDRMPAQREELHEALEEGIVLHASATLVTVTAEPGVPLAIACSKVRLEESAATASPAFTTIAGTEFTLRADTVIVAIGQQPDLTPFPGVASSRGLVAVDGGQSSAMDKVWAGGDVASMGRFVTQAVAMGKHAAIDIDRRLRGLPRAQAVAAAPVGPQEIAHWYHARSPRAAGTHLPVPSRLATGAEVQLPLSPAQARTEASRCFSCGNCTSCDNCFQYCPDLAVTHVEGGYAVLADYCKGCGVCVRECPTGSMLLQEEAQ